MGACDFVDLVKEPDLEKAFNKAVDSAQYEHGHGGYSGSIAEKGNYVVINAKPRTEAEAFKFADAVMSAEWNEAATQAERAAYQQVRDKWGPAGAIAVCTSVANDMDEISVTVDVDPVSDPSKIKWEALLRAEGKLKSGDVLDRINVVEKNERTRLEAKRTEGTAITRYFYVQPRVPNGRLIERGDPRNWLSGFMSMADWRAHAKRMAKEYGGRYETFAITRRFDDEPLDVVEAVVTKRKMTVKASIIRASNRQLTTDAWLFFGWASS